MEGNSRLITILSMALMVGFSVGCGKEEPTASQSSPTPALAGNWQPTMPARFAGLTVRDGGTCYLDLINNLVNPDAPVPIKSGAPVFMGGWAVADVKAGRLATAVGVQLDAATPYFIVADSYVRRGLGAALKSPSLEGGGLKLDPTALNVPPGDYRVFFLLQSDHDLLRCNTARRIHVE
jgi:hypothetical protein